MPTRISSATRITRNYAYRFADQIRRSANVFIGTCFFQSPDALVPVAAGIGKIFIQCADVALPAAGHHDGKALSMSLATSNSRRSLDNITDTLLPELESARRMLATLL